MIFLGKKKTMSWKEIFTAFGQPSIQPNIKWKRCDGFIIEFEKNINTAVTNEDRNGVRDSRFAKFRADKNSLIVKRIYNASKSIWEQKILHKCGSFLPIVYEVGLYATPDGFNSNINIIRGSGAHFFNSLLAAFFFTISKSKDDIEFMETGEIRKVCCSRGTVEQFLTFHGLKNPVFIKTD